MDEDSCMVILPAFPGLTVDSCAHPCRIGTKRLLEMLDWESRAMQVCDTKEEELCYYIKENVCKWILELPPWSFSWYLGRI